MNTVNMLEAKSSLSRLVKAIEEGKEQEIIIARNGRPAAKLVPLAHKPDLPLRFGMARGLFTIPNNIDSRNDEIAALFRACLNPCV